MPSFILVPLGGGAARAELVGSYFRMKVHLTYKGKPVDIDFVAGCSTRYINYAYGGTTVEPVGMSAFVFGARMPEGHAVVIRTVPYENNHFKSPCDGATTANGEVPKDWLPLIVWYERDDEFAHGIGYATQDAYENPNAKFGFRGVAVEHATKEEFEAFMRDGPHNLLPAYLTDWLTHLGNPQFRSVDTISLIYKLHPAKAWAFTDRPVCRSARKIALTQAQRENIRKLWPLTHPSYWSPKDYQAQVDAGRVLTEDQRVRDVATFDVPYTNEDRLETRKVYPIAPDEALASLSPQTGKGGWYFHDILVDDSESLGFIYCDSPSPFELEGAITGHIPTEAERGTHFRCRIGTTVLPIRPSLCVGELWIAFERDEFAIISQDDIIN